MVKIGIMSFAHMHAYSYASCLRQLPGTELSVIWDDDVKRGKAMAKKFGAMFTPNLETFLLEDMEGVIITSENVKHRMMVEAAAEAGKWILCEKPLAPTTKDAQAMVSVCRKRGVGLGTAFPCRYASPIIEAKSLLESGSYGPVYAVSCTNHGQFPGGWFAENSLSGGGATMDHTVHVIDLLRWMLKKEFVSVYCELGNQLHKNRWNTDDLGSLHLVMEDGIQVSHIASWSRPASFPTWGDVTLEFICEGGVINVDAFNQKIVVFNDRTMRVHWAGWGDNPDMGLIRDFVEVVKDKRSPSVTGEDGLKATQVTEAAYHSSTTRKAVRIK